jgi:hypothetical protein
MTKWLVGLFVVVLGAPAAYAQEEGSITGTVKDSSGAVLPGVTVEASSPALIEKVRTVLTDGAGQYRVVNLRPGTYAVSFTLSGFNVVKREGIELTGAFIATVNAELKVGSLAETITVSGESPIVDVQNARKQQILSKDVVDALPSARTQNTIAVLVPGVSLPPNGQDVGGTTQIFFQSPVIHGSYSADSRIQIDGFSTSNTQQTDMSVYTANMGSAQEVNVNVGAGAGEQSAAGLILNIIPKEGGNTFSGSFFGAFANDKFQADNFTQRLKDKGLKSVSSVKQNYEANPAVGGPIVKDKLWFYASGRWARSEKIVGGIFANVFAGQANVYKYQPDFGNPGTTFTRTKDGNGRVTWQVNAKNKVNLYFQRQVLCACDVVGTGANAASQRLFTPEAAINYSYDYPIFTATWSSPITSRLLLEAGFFRKGQDEAYSPEIPTNDPRLNLIPVTDNVANTGNGTAGTLFYHGVQPIYGTVWNQIGGRVYQARSSMSYVSGAHAFKVGWDGRFNNAAQRFHQDNNFDLRYTFNLGIPVSLTEIAAPYDLDQSTTDVAVYAQDRWTIKRTTLNLGVRYDKFHSYFPDHFFGPGLLTPTRNFTIPGDDVFNYNDITPKLAVAYDVRGDGKTSVKASINKYAGSMDPVLGNPTRIVATSGTRSWTDANGNFVPDCNLVALGANGECGALPSNFGQKVATAAAFDPNSFNGWGKRAYVWEFSAGVQQQVLPRVSVEGTYYRRWNGNFLVTVNRALSISDYDAYSVTAPVDPRLPNGGGYTVSGLYDLKPSKTVGGIPTDLYRTLTDTYGNAYDHWNGFDININARPGHGLFLQGGLSAGRSSDDICDVVGKAIITEAATTKGFFMWNNLPNGALAPNSPSPLYCHVDQAITTNLKAYGTYTIPRIEVQVAATLQSFPGPTIAAQVPYTSAQVAPSLGRPLSTSTITTVNVIEPGQNFTERVNQLDLRFGKVIKYGHARATVALDLYNALNADTILIQTDSYVSASAWQTPLLVTQGRLAKVSLQFNFD